MKGTKNCHYPSQWVVAFALESGRRDSNPRISAWKADALPLGHARICIMILIGACAVVKESRPKSDDPIPIPDILDNPIPNIPDCGRVH